MLGDLILQCKPSLGLLLSCVSPHSWTKLDAAFFSPLSIILSVILFFCSVYMIQKRAFHFVSNRTKQFSFFASVRKTKEKEYFLFYPKLLYAYGHIHFAWFHFIAKAIKPITHTALDSSGVISFPKPRWKLPPLGNKWSISHRFMLL